MRKKLFSLATSFSSFLHVAPTRTLVRFAPIMTESASFSSSACRGDEKLLGVQVIYRHGARTPVYNIPTTTTELPPPNWPLEITSDVEETVVPFSLVSLDGQPSSNDIEMVGKFLSIKELPGGARSGWLTRKGQMELQSLGRRLRERYATNLGFISKQFNSQEVYSRSTRYPRNIASTRCLFSGLFDPPSETGEQFKIHVSEFEAEILSPNRFSSTVVMESTSLYKPRDFPPGMMAARERAQQLFGQDCLIYTKTDDDGTVIYSRPARLHTIRDELICRIHHDMPVSEEVREYTTYLDHLCPLEMVEHVCGPKKYWETKGFPAAAGQFCQLILDNLAEQSASKNHRMRLFATHDDMLITFMLILDVFEGEWPKFGSDLVLELYEKGDGSHFVRIAFRNKILAEKPLSEVNQLLKQYAITPEEYERIRHIGFDSKEDLFV